MWFLQKVVFVTAALTIPLGKKEAVEQLFYFCGKKLLTAEASLV